MRIKRMRSKCRAYLLEKTKENKDKRKTNNEITSGHKLRRILSE